MAFQALRARLVRHLRAAAEIREICPPKRRMGDWGIPGTITSTSSQVLRALPISRLTASEDPFRLGSVVLSCLLKGKELRSSVASSSTGRRGQMPPTESRMSVSPEERFLHCLGVRSCRISHRVCAWDYCGKLPWEGVGKTRKP